MADPLGLIGGGQNAAQRAMRAGLSGSGGNAAGETGGGPSFKDTLMKNLDEVNKLQQEATRAVEDLQTGQRTDVEGVILATAKADNAFRMLQALRNRVMEAYDEVKQIRT